MIATTTYLICKNMNGKTLTIDSADSLDDALLKMRVEAKHDYGDDKNMSIKLNDVSVEVFANPTNTTNANMSTVASLLTSVTDFLFSSSNPTNADLNKQPVVKYSYIEAKADLNAGSSINNSSKHRYYKADEIKELLQAEKSDKLSKIDELKFAKIYKSLGLFDHDELTKWCEENKYNVNKYNTVNLLNFLGMVNKYNHNTNLEWHHFHQASLLNDLYAFKQVGSLMIRLCKYQDAVDCYKRAKEQHPNDLELQAQLEQAEAKLLASKPREESKNKWSSKSQQIKKILLSTS